MRATFVVSEFQLAAPKHLTTKTLEDVAEYVFLIVVTHFHVLLKFLHVVIWAVLKPCQVVI